MKQDKKIIIFIFIIFLTITIPSSAQELSPRSLYESARTEYKAGRYDEALKISKESLKKITPNSISCINLNYLITACFYKLGKSNFDNKKYFEALLSFQKILKDYPESNYAKNALLFSAHCYHLLKKRKEAYKFYRNYFTKYGKRKLKSIDYYYIGQNFRILEHKRKAFWYLRKAIRKNIKDKSLLDKIKVEMKHCLTTLFRSPVGTIKKIVVANKDIWVLRSASSPAFMNSLSRFNKVAKRWIVYNYEDGYIPAGLSSMVVDDCNVWIGTYESGLIRYNFIEDTWRYYSVRDGLSGSNVSSLAKDGNIIWIGGKSTIIKFDSRNDTFEKFVLPVNFDGVRCLAVNNKYVWIAGGWYKSKPLIRLNKNAEDWMNKWTIIPNKEFKAKHIHTIVVDKKELWLGTSEGARKYDFETKKWKCITIKSGGAGVQSIVIKDPYVYLGSWGVTIRYNRITGKIKRYSNLTGSPNAGQCLSMDGKHLIFGHYSTVGKMDPDTGYYIKNIQAVPLTSNYVKDILVGRKYIWVSAQDGLNRCNKRNLKWKHFTQKEGLPDNLIFSLVPYKNKILAGVRKFGTVKFDNRFSKITPFQYKKENPKEELRPLLLDGNIIWFQALNSENRCRYIYYGLKEYNASTGKWIFFSTENGLLHNRIYSIASDKKFIWIGTMKGVNRYNKKLHKMETFLKTDRLIYTLKPDNDDIWISIHCQGLAKYNKITGQGKFYIIEKRKGEKPVECSYSEKHNLPNTWVEDIQIDRKFLLLATGKGLFIYDKKNKKWFNLHDDRKSLDYWLALIRFDNDFLWLGYRYRGVTRFDKKLWLKYRKIFPSDNK